MSDTTDTGNDKTTATADVAPAQPAPPARSGGGGAVFFAVVLSLLASGALVVGSPYWTPLADKYIKLPNPLKQLAGETARLDRAVIELDGRVAAATAENGKLKDAVAAAGGAVSGVKAATLALAGAQLRARLASGEAYDVELAAVRAVAGDDAEVKAVLATLAPHATLGAPTRAVVRDGFSRAVAAVVAAEAESAAKSAAGWYESVTALFGQLGYVMQVNPAPEGSVHAVARQARARLAAGDLAGAAQELSTLPEPRAPEAEEWLASAQARVAADKADGALATLILARLGASK